MAEKCGADDRFSIACGAGATAGTVLDHAHGGICLVAPVPPSAPARSGQRRARCDTDDEMSEETMTGYLPGDPRYGLSGEALKDYYRTKPAEWAIYCWDKPGMAATRAALSQGQQGYVKSFGERV